MPKDFNPPNAPELRPIEKYRAIMKQALRKHPKEVQNLMSSVERKVRAFGYGIEIE